MKVILLKELKGRGGEGDVIDVAQGFAVNYLLPQGIAIEATKGELKQLEQRRHNIAKRELARTTDAGTIKDALEGKTVTIPAKVGEEGHLFGSVTAPMIADAVIEQIGVTIDRKRVDLGKTIKMVGTYPVSISIYREIKATVNVEVVDEDAQIEITEEPAEAEVETEAVEEAVEEIVEEAEATEEAAE